MPASLKRYSAFDYFICGAMIFLALIFIYPIYYIIAASFSRPIDIIMNPIITFPRSFTIFNYQMLLSTNTIAIGYRNTIFYIMLGTTINVALTVWTAYGLAQPDLPARKYIMFFIIFTMFFSGGMIPLFLVVRNLRMINTIWAILLPTAISTWNLLITRTYISQQIPQELYEAAHIDGAHEYRIFFQVVLPLVKPVVVVITMFYAATIWNSWFNAMIFVSQRRELFPLQLFLREILINDATSGMLDGDENERAMYLLTLKYAVMTISILPLMVVFPFIQKHFVKGVMIGALKG
jgi:putative aldouronate transport system permease protein